MTKTKTKAEDKKIIYTKEHNVACDGGGGAGGHPKTYYDLGDNGHAECLYCGQVFELKH